MNFDYSGCLLVGSTLAALAAAQFVPPPTDLITAHGYAGVNVRYKQIPNGICETNPNVKSYSGYADIGPHEHIHFWFFEAREVDPTQAPLALWIDGGPGSSSALGVFQEPGPCRVDAQGKVYNNPYSWSTHSNLMFIDQPSTVPFSYTDTVDGYMDPNSGQIFPLNGSHCPQKYAGQCGTFSQGNPSNVPNSTANAAPALWKTLQGIMGAFPQYARHGFHLSTESYGGHYGPVFSEYIEQQNSNIPKGAMEIHLESVTIGNGWFDPAIHYVSHYNFTVKNSYDVHFYNESAQKYRYEALYGKGGCLDGLARCDATGNNKICSDADNYCANNVEYLDNFAGRDPYDIRELVPDPFPYSYFVNYLNQPHVQKAIGAYTNFSAFSYAVGEAFGNTGDDGRIAMTIEDTRKLVAQGVYFVSYAGDAGRQSLNQGIITALTRSDYICNWVGNQAVAQKVNAPGYSKAGFANISTSDNVVHGVVAQSNNYAFVRVYEAGHQTVFYQPVLGLTMFNRVISGLDIATGTKRIGPGYFTKGPHDSTYHEGNKTVQFKVLPANATYNTTTNEPNPPA